MGKSVPVQSVDFNSFLEYLRVRFPRRYREPLPNFTLISCTLKQVLKLGGAGPGGGGLPMPCVYIVESEKEVLYVGATRYNANIRLNQHRRANSKLGKAIKENSNSENWLVKVITMPNYSIALQEEKRYIKKFNPVFNEIHNKVA